jgi:hypothetical protein
MNTCPGCAKTFEHTGYSHHLSKTTNPACTALLQHSGLFPQSEDEDDRDSDSDSDHDGFDGGTQDNFNSDSQHLTEFTGDYFGNYDEQDLEWPEARVPLDSDAEDEQDDSEDHVSEVEHGWERPADPVLQDFDVMVDFEESDPSSQRHAAERQEVEKPLGRQPTIEKFPRRHAGAPIHISGTTAFESYNNVLRGADNVWAPFVSRIDYEVAKWAKLRGSGSTAFSELLAVEGVSFLFLGS